MGVENTEGTYGVWCEIEGGVSRKEWLKTRGTRMVFESKSEAVEFAGRMKKQGSGWFRPGVYATYRAKSY